MDPENALNSLLAGAAIYLGRFVGMDDLLASRLVSMTAASAAVVGVWRLSFQLRPRLWASIYSAAVMLSCSRFFYHAAMGERPKIFLVCFVVLALERYAAGGLFFAGFFAAAAFLSWQPGAVVLLTILGSACLVSDWRTTVPRILAGFFTGLLLYESYFLYHGALGDQLYQSYATAVSARFWLYTSRGALPTQLLSLAVILSLPLVWWIQSRLGPVSNRSKALLAVAGATMLFAWGASQLLSSEEPTASTPTVKSAPAAANARVHSEATALENLKQSLKFLGSFGLPNRRDMPPFAFVYLLLCALLLLTVALRPLQSLQVARKSPGTSATAATAIAVTLFTLVDHQAYPDTFFILPFVALSCGLAFDAMLEPLSRPLPRAVTAVLSLVVVVLIAQQVRLEVLRLGPIRFKVDEQRELAQEVLELRDQYGTVWGLGCLHLLAFAHMDNHSRVGHLMQPTVNTYMKQKLLSSYRDLFVDRRLPEIILSSRGGEFRHLPWLMKGYRRLPLESFKKQGVVVMLKTDQAVGLAEAYANSE